MSPICFKHVEKFSVNHIHLTWKSCSNYQLDHQTIWTEAQLLLSLYHQSILVDGLNLICFCYLLYIPSTYICTYIATVKFLCFALAELQRLIFIMWLYKQSTVARFLLWLTSDLFNGASPALPN